MRRALCLLAIAALTALPMSLTASAAAQYRSLRITAPANDSTVHDNSGNLVVRASVSPPLAAGDRLHLFIDGAPAGEARSGIFHLADVPRGEHTLEVEVRDAGGAVLLRSAPVVVNVWRASALAPNRQRR